MTEEIPGLQTSIDGFIENLKAKLPPLPQGHMVDGKVFTGSYSLIIDNKPRPSSQGNHTYAQQLYKLYLTYGGDEEKKYMGVLVIQVPTKYLQYADCYTEALLTYLDKVGLKTRDVAKQLDQQLRTPDDINRRIEAVLQNLFSQIKLPFPITAPIEERTFNGQYSSSTKTGKDNSVRIQVIVTIFNDGIWKKYQHIPLTVPKMDRDKAQDYLNAISKSLEDSGLIPSKHPLNEEHIYRRINGILAEAVKKYPNEFECNYKGGIQGIFTTSLCLPSISDDKNIGVHINLRGLSDYLKRETHYINNPAEFTVNTNTRNEEDARRIENYIHDALRSLGFEFFSLTKAARPGVAGTKEIPKEWIDTKNITMKSSRGGGYLIHITPGTKRQPLIVWATRTKDQALAERKLAILRDELLPLYLTGGIYEPKPLTLNVVTKEMALRCPQVEQRVQSNRHHDIRLIPSDNPKVKLLTPNIKPNKDSFYCIQRFLPFEGTDPNYCRAFAHQLNTSDRRIAELCSHRIQTLTEIILTDYFKQHSDISIITQMEPSKKGMSLTYKIPELNEQAPPNQIFLRTLYDEHIKPAL